MAISPLAGGQRLLLLIGLLLAWPLAMNGGPIFFSDTTSYVRAADAVAYRATGHATIWSDVISSAEKGAAARAGAASGAGAGLAVPGASVEQQSSSFEKNIILGRSIFYGGLLYCGVLLGGLALSAGVQALLAGVAIIGGIRHFADPAREPIRFRALVLAAMAIAAGATSLPYFASFLMPDVFAGLAIWAAAMVLTGWARESFGWRLFWAALLCFAALAHALHMLLLVALGGVGCGLRLLRGRSAPLAPIALLFGAAAVGLAGDAAFQLGIGALAHRETVRPPFLAMRVIADGPGAAYLREDCARTDFALCAFRGAPSSNSDVLLWSADPRLGMFTSASAADQRRIAREQMGFVAAVVWRYPGWTMAAMLGNFARQLRLLGLREFSTPVLADPEVAARMPPPVRMMIARSPAERGALPTVLYRWLVWPVTLLAIGITLIAVRREGWRIGGPALVMGMGIVLNAAICGMLSVPADRYQDRVAWLVVLFAVLAWRNPAPKSGFRR